MSYFIDDYFRWDPAKSRAAAKGPIPDPPYDPMQGQMNTMFDSKNWPRSQAPVREIDDPEEWNRMTQVFFPPR